MFLSAQNHKPTTMWPYLYPDFREATIRFSDGKEAKNKINFHLLHNTLHYINGESVMEVRSTADSYITQVSVGPDLFVFKDNEFIFVEAEKNGNYLGTVTIGDFSKLTQSTGAYGMSTEASATKALSSIEIGGRDNMNHQYILSNKENGKTLPVKVTTYFVIGDKLIPAKKSNVEKEISSAKVPQFNDFVKKEKIKWKNQESLKKVLNFISN